MFIKKIIICGIILLTTTLFSEARNNAIISGFLNDNYTGSTENGVSGTYIGADDFLTFALFVNGKSNNWGSSFYYQLVTSRKYGYRYDLLSTSISYSFILASKNIMLTPTLSMLNMGAFGGEFVQNTVHEFRDIPYLVQEYLENEFGLAFGGTATYFYGPIKGSVNVEIPTGIKPINLNLDLEYSLEMKYLDINLATGYRQYINSINNYSTFIRSGFNIGGQMVIPIYRGFTINAGVFFFPTRNLDNDPIFQDKDFSYSPQFWVTLGLNGGELSIKDVVKF